MSKVEFVIENDNTISMTMDRDVTAANFEGIIQISKYMIDTIKMKNRVDEIDNTLSDIEKLIDELLK